MSGKCFHLLTEEYKFRTSLSVIPSDHIIACLKGKEHMVQITHLNIKLLYSCTKLFHIRCISRWT